MWHSEPGNPQCGIVGSKSSKSVYNEYRDIRTQYDRGKAQANTHRHKLDPSLKGQCHEIFCFWFFYVSVFPQPQSIPLGPFRIFFENSRRYSQVKVHHRCQRHRWQIMRTISGCRDLKVNLKAKIYIYVNSTTQRCPNKIIEIFLLEDFSICHRCR